MNNPIQSSSAVGHLLIPSQFPKCGEPDLPQPTMQSIPPKAKRRTKRIKDEKKEAFFKSPEYKKQIKMIRRQRRSLRMKQVTAKQYERLSQVQARLDVIIKKSGSALAGSRRFESTL
jgi:hypothetical protein